MEFALENEIESKENSLKQYSTKKNIQELNLTYNGEKLSRDPNLKFLGVHLDSRVNFFKHLNKIKEKCNQRALQE